MKRRLWIVLSIFFLIGCQSTLSQVYKQHLILGEGREWRAYPLVVDLNNDGYQDIVATYRQPARFNTLDIWLGNGDGTFKEMKKTWSSPGYSALATGDINHDGYPDIIAASHFSKIQTLLSNGTGGFTESIMKTNDGYVAAHLKDVNNDGHLDAIVLGYEKVGIEIYKGDGTGKWKLLTRLMEGSIGKDMATGDLDNDGNDDIVASFVKHGVVIYYGNNKGEWSHAPTDFYSTTGLFQSIALGDINHDGHLDIALNGGSEGYDKPNGPDIYLGDGKRKWTEASKGLKAFKISPGVIALDDISKDGHLDIITGGNIVGEIGNGNFGLFLFTGNSEEHWFLQTESGLPSKGLNLSYGIALADLNNDGLLDIVVTHGTTEHEGGYLSVWLHQ